jgi:hypothetical protein
VIAARRSFDECPVFHGPSPLARPWGRVCRVWRRPSPIRFAGTIATGAGPTG